MFKKLVLIQGLFHCSVINLRFVVASAATRLYYHDVSFLSTTFFFYFETFQDFKIVYTIFSIPDFVSAPRSLSARL